MRQVAKSSLFVLLAAASIVVACSWVAEAPPADRPAAEDEPPPEEVAEQVDFASQILPIVRRCEPCHFEGGKMYAELPFDDPATLRHLGERLFTRIKDADEQTLLRAFFAQRSSGL